MPIQFRCTGCNQKLAITRRKAGKVVTCPACATDVQVPTLEDAAALGLLVESPQETGRRTSGQATARPTAEEGVGEGIDEPPPPSEEEVTEPHESAPEEAFTQPLEAQSADLTAADSVWEEEEEDEEEGFHLTRRASEESGLDMTPMVDVTFLLLIFFMITATFSLQKSMETEAPEPDQEGFAQMPTIEDLADDSVIVEIDENDSIFVDDVQVGSIADLEDLLAQKMSGEQKLEMIIEPHPQAKHGTVVQATDAGIEVGMQRIRRVTRQGE